MKKLALAIASVIALTSATAFADEPAPTPAPIANVTVTATPLQTRPAKPLQLASEKNEGTPFGYKLLVGAVLVGAAAVYVKKKRGIGSSKSKKKTSSIDVLARTSIGVRNELLVIDVEGTRLLVGMTPSSMQTLAVLQTPEGVVGHESPFMGEEAYMDDAPALPIAAPALHSVKPLREQVEPGDQHEDEQEEEVEELSERVRSLLAARKKRAEAEARPAAAPIRRAPVAAAPASRARVPGQAKGLLLSLQENVDTKHGASSGEW